ncbi:MAG: hypothetical protein H6585_01325 [Flavobacteriales bacterium]|nr:hypothetical protein [Flavobacteriales bacterium]
MRSGANFYEEAGFDFNQPACDEADLQFLDDLMEMLKQARPITEIHAMVHVRHPRAALLKLIHFFSAEFYLSADIEPDRHGRVSGQGVHVHHRKYLTYPVTDVLGDLLRIQLGTNPGIHPKEVVFTCDFDILNIWDAVGTTGTFKILFKQLVKGNWRRMIRNLVSIRKGRSNPVFNPYLNDDMFAKNYGLAGGDVTVRNIAFWLMTRDDEQYDVCNDFSQPAVRHFIRQLDESGVAFGLHPGYDALYQPARLKRQMGAFENTFGRRAQMARLHYLKFFRQDDLSALDPLGIQEDYSFGFADDLMFRGGRSFPARMWCFREQAVMQVKSYPLTLMDGTFSDYLRVNGKQAKELALEKISRAMMYGHTIVLLWHNRSMVSDGIPGNYHPRLFRSVYHHIFGK